MQLLDDQLVLSASDLNNFLACGHLTTLDLARARGETGAPPDRGADAELLAEKGNEHERQYLEKLEVQGLKVVRIDEPEDRSRSALEAAAAQTEEALRAGPDVIYQATFFRPAEGLVAGITRRQRDLLRAAGFDTLAALGSARQLSAPGVGVDVLERLHEQASLQLGARRTGEHAYRLLAPREGRGFARLPRPSPGDVFFDMEGDPFFDGGGLEYLFGLITADGERPEFTAIWGRDRAEEKRALEEFVDLIVARRRRFGDLHVYHYASYEITALKRLAGAHGTREEELDQLLRDEVFVDLYKVVREGLRISQPSYSIKKVEAFYMDARETAVTDGGDSIVKFERWLEEGEGSILDEIAAYNEDDCLSTLRLRDWLLERRAEAEREFEGSEEARWIEWFEPGAPIDHDGMELEERKEIVAALDGSHLFIQGPPGSGKTYTGARLIVDLIGRGQRVGVTSTSHKVIHNLLEEVEKAAAEGGVEFRGLKKSSAGNPESEFASERGLVDSVADNAALNDPEARLTAGTAWHYCREDTEPLDYLFIDEAGQVSLADALALSTAARNVVLLGDPQQLPQVAGAAHPEGTSLSVLEHLLGERQTVDPACGVFLERTWRLHPDVCAFVSELMYDGRLRSAPGRERQRIDAEGELTGTGLRWLPVEHEGRSQSSEEEADRIAKAIEPLLNNATYTDDEGNQKPLEPSDILVVTPYNAQVKCLQDRLPPNIRIGTVDKFQGQEAQIAFFSMATSSSEEIPRNVEFLFSRNRLNVAISRARCLAVLVASPKLLDIKANSIEQMWLVNALCRFSEIATVLPLKSS